MVCVRFPTSGQRSAIESLTRLIFSSEGERFCVLLSEIHKSLCLLVKKSSLLKKPSTDVFGLTSKVFAS